MKYYPTIFNDVLSPITPGPSSSNTIAPFRIGLLGRDLLGGKPVNLSIEMSEAGGFFSSFYSMQSDKAFLGGFLGKDPLEFDLETAYDTAEASGLSFQFAFSDRIAPLPREMAEITLSSTDETIVFTAVSAGGGEIEINRLNGQNVFIDGRNTVTVMVSGTSRTVHGLYPIPTNPQAVPPFTTSAGMLAYAAEKKRTLWQAALDYETSLSGLSQASVLELAERVLDVSYESIKAGYQKGLSFDGITTAKAAEIKKTAEARKLIPAGASSQGSLDALAIMEYSNAHGTIVCMPTGGASGVVPAAIKNAAWSLGLGKEHQVRALLTAGLIGLFYFPTHYSGTIGCQAEIGVAVSMAAAGLASYLTDDPTVVEKAAVMGIQSLLGLICDPIGGYVQVPCFIRNMTAVSTAVTCANAALCGLDTLISVDEMADTLLRIGGGTRALNDFGICFCKKKEG